MSGESQPTDTPTAPAPAPAAPAADPVPSGGVPAGYVPQADFDGLEARRRSTQSALDQEKAKTAALEQRVTAVESKFDSFDPNKFADEFTARFNHNQAMAKTAADLKGTYPHARADLYDRQFATPEELTAAVKASHDAEVAYRDGVRNELRGEMAAELKEKHGVVLPTLTPQTPAGEQPTGNEGPDEKALAGMSVLDLAAMDDADLPPALR